MKNAQMDLRSLLVTKLNALYDIESNLIKALPKMEKAATDPELKQAFADHLEETENQAVRLEQAHALLGEKPRKFKVEGIRGIIADSESIIKSVEPEEALDANLVRAAQYVEHYEMAGYMGALAWAETLGETKVAALLEETLDEEMSTDEKLKTIGDMLDKKIIGEDEEDEEIDDEPIKEMADKEDEL